MQGGHGELNPLGGENVEEAGNERGDGRPAGVPTTAGNEPEGRPTGVANAPVAGSSPADEAPTVAPEEEGAEPATEHSPGSDL